jgi:hypothetical protein
MRCVENPCLPLLIPLNFFFAGARSDPLISLQEKLTGKYFTATLD